MIKYFPIFGKCYPREQWISLDLSEANAALDYERTAEPEYLRQFIENRISNEHPVAFGGYQEKRATYRNAAHFSDKPEEEMRCIHLGIDLWVAAGTEIFAPLDGEVHSFKFNDIPFDYGPTIILKHDVSGETFYTLYGHLNLDSLEMLAIGKVIKQGQCFARVGHSDVNGGWPPHLHFQIIKDMFGWHGDFPGATSEKEREIYLRNSPNPALLLNL
jgi:murein DD-endopeptidase MepM/ murein hydrolase activator NlpD